MDKAIFPSLNITASTHKYSIESYVRKQSASGRWYLCRFFRSTYNARFPVDQSMVIQQFVNDIYSYLLFGEVDPFLKVDSNNGMVNVFTPDEDQSDEKDRVKKIIGV